MKCKFLVIACLLLALPVCGTQAANRKTVLLLGQRRDHPPGSHEYMPGLRVLAKCLEQFPSLQVKLVAADEPWPEGPDLLAEADGVVLYLGQGGRWIQLDEKRLQAIEQLAARGAGIVALHWAIGAKDDKYIEPHRSLIGAVHGGHDRKYIITTTLVRVARPQHPIAFGIGSFTLKDEFYYRLKFAAKGKVIPILQVTIDEKCETVAWAYERPDGGRSFGFSGLHFHDNWRLPECRRLVTQAVLWTLRLPVPSQGVDVHVPEELFQLP